MKCLRDHEPPDKVYLSDSRVASISKSFTHKMAAKPAGIDMQRKYVTVTLCRDLLVWFEIAGVSTEYGERVNMRPQHGPVRQAVSIRLVAQPLKHAIHVLQVASVQLHKHDKAVIDRRLRPRCCHTGSYFKRPKSSPVSPLACNWYYCAVYSLAQGCVCAALQLGGDVAQPWLMICRKGRF